MDCIIEMKLPSSPISTSSTNTNDSMPLLEQEDLMDYVNDFINDEVYYYEYIKSYCNGNNIKLYIQQENKSSVSAAYLDIDNKVYEYTRDKENIYTIHDSIWKWVNDNNKLINSVYIGDNYVPLRRILQDSYEDNIINKEEYFEDTNEYTCMNIVLGIWVICSLILVFILYLCLIKYI